MGPLGSASIIVSIVGMTLLSTPPAIALPFNPESVSFENYVNAVWRNGGSDGIKLGMGLTSDDPQDRRLYHGFHGCQLWEPSRSGWMTVPARVDGDDRHNQMTETVEGFSCKGYLDPTTPTGSRRCKINIQYSNQITWKEFPGQYPFQSGRTKFLTADGCSIFY